MGNQSSKNKGERLVFLDIPDEIIRYIFSLLDSERSQKLMRIVNKELNQILKNEPEFKKIYIERRENDRYDQKTYFNREQKIILENSLIYVDGGDYYCKFVRNKNKTFDLRFELKCKNTHLRFGTLSPPKKLLFDEPIYLEDIKEQNVRFFTSDVNLSDQKQIMINFNNEIIFLNYSLMNNERLIRFNSFHLKLNKIKYINYIHNFMIDSDDNFYLFNILLFHSDISNFYQKFKLVEKIRNINIYDVIRKNNSERYLVYDNNSDIFFVGNYYLDRIYYSYHFLKTFESREDISILELSDNIDKLVESGKLDNFYDRYFRN
jgi:hypothetical protein